MSSMDRSFGICDLLEKDDDQLPVVVAKKGLGDKVGALGIFLKKR